MDTKTILAYNIHARDYEKEVEDFWDKFPKTFINKFVELSGKNLLDIGSGSGRDGLILKSHDKKIICLDASEEMIKISSEKGLDSISGDFNKLPFETNHFDGVWAYTSLLHVPKSEIYIAIREVKRVLKSNGILGLGLIEGEGEILRISNKIKMERLFSYYKKDEVVDLLKKEGFEFIYFETFKPGSNNYLNFIFKKI